MSPTFIYSNKIYLHVRLKADVALLRLPAPSLRGTFAKAYALLTLLVAKIGWDELLKCRSSVFVMEEEYRKQKAAEEERKHQKNSSTATAALPRKAARLAPPP